MKILHTSDLHLGDTWRGFPRMPDQLRVLNEVLDLCVTHQVELLLVTGDIFGDRLEGKLPDIARQFLQLIHDRLSPDQVVFLLRGNHDSLAFFQLLRALVNEWAVPYRVPLIIAEQMEVYKIPNKNLQVLAMPYLTSKMIEHQKPEANMPPEAQVNRLEGSLVSFIAQLGQKVDPLIPVIFAGHIYLRGAKVNNETMVEQGSLRDLTLSSKDLPDFTSYNALGHIHLSQQVRSIKTPTWYSGGPDRMDLGEQGYTPQVLLVTLPDDPAGIAEVETIPLKTCTPFMHQTVAGVSEVYAFCNQVAGTNPLGVVDLSNIPIELRADTEQDIHDAAPRMELRWVFEPTPLTGIENIGSGPDYFDVGATVQTYLESKFGEDPERLARLIKAFQALKSTSN